MLYPDFKELIAFKDLKLKLVHTSHRAVKTSVAGNHHSPFRGQGLEFDSVREYVAGDDIRNIDWRVTARTGSPHLKVFRQERERHIVLCLDMNASMRFGTRKTFKSVQAAKTAALLGWKGLAEHDSISTHLFGDVQEGIQFFPAKRTHHSFCTMLKTLSQPSSFQKNVPLLSVIQKMTRSTLAGSLIYIISDFMEEPNPLLEKELGKLTRECDVVFIAINDPADKSICSVGTLGFSSNGMEKVFINTDSLAGRDAYKDLWAKNRDALYSLASKLKIPLVELTTESNVHRDLVLSLKSIAKRKRR